MQLKNFKQNIGSILNQQVETLLYNRVYTQLQKSLTRGMDRHLNIIPPEGSQDNHYGILEAHILNFYPRYFTRNINIEEILNNCLCTFLQKNKEIISKPYKIKENTAFKINDWDIIVHQQIQYTREGLINYRNQKNILSEREKLENIGSTHVVKKNSLL